MDGRMSMAFLLTAQGPAAAPFEFRFWPLGALARQAEAVVKFIKKDIFAKSTMM
ncbi:hypothetical protein ACLOJK_030818 [Asimina triloba]